MPIKTLDISYQFEIIVQGIIEKYNNEAIIVIVKLKEAQGLITEAKDLFDNGTTYKEVF